MAQKKASTAINTQTSIFKKKQPVYVIKARLAAAGSADKAPFWKKKK
jgi:hypothetical protein